jgi:RNA polymerase sigma factor (sigma-70 family)
MLTPPRVTNGRVKGPVLTTHPAEHDRLLKALEELHASAFRWSLHCCRGDRSEAEDVLQTVYVKVLAGGARFAGQSSFRTWLFAVIRLTAYEGRRTVARWLRRGALLAGMAVEADGAPSGFDRLRADDELRRIEGLLAGLSARQREVLRLVFCHDLTIEEAAQVMGVTLGSARVHYQRGKERLKKALEGNELAGSGSGRSAAIAL